jgi:hypothetical protein
LSQILAVHFFQIIGCNCQNNNLEYSEYDGSLLLTSGPSGLDHRTSIIHYTCIIIIFVSDFVYFAIAIAKGDSMLQVESHHDVDQIFTK